MRDSKAISSSTNMWKFDEFNDSKARNRLSLQERVQAIKEYEKTRNFSKVGLMFKCSAKQIRNIVLRKEEIQAMYEALPSHRIEDQKPSAKRRQRKISLLGNVMYEWFLRARRNPSICIISYKLIQDVTLEVRKLLNVENFYPNNAWLLNFRQKYNISDSDMKVQSEDDGPIDLNVETIIADVLSRQREKDESTSNLDSSSNSTGQKDEEEDVDNRSGALDLFSIEDNYVEPPAKYRKLEQEQCDIIEIDSDDEDGEDEEQENTVVITNIDQALRHLKPLEDFALMNENFRAIGLISQLELILSSSKKRLK